MHATPRLRLPFLLSFALWAGIFLAPLTLAAPAFAQCTGEVAGPPVTEQGLKVLHWTSRAAAGAPWTQTNCFLLANVGATQMTLSADLHIEEGTNPGRPGPWAMATFATQDDLPSGQAVSCTVLPPSPGRNFPDTIRIAPASGTLASGRFTDACCVAWQATGQGQCTDLPLAGDVGHVDATVGGTGLDLDMVFQNSTPAGGSTCGLLGLEIIVLLPFAWWRRRRLARGSVAAAAGIVAMLAIALPADRANAADVTLGVDDSNTQLSASLDVFFESAQGVDLSGNLHATVSLVDDPTHGVVATSVEITHGTLDADDLDWILNQGFVSVLASLDDGEIDGSSAVLPATATGANTATVDLSGITLEIDAGQFDASGDADGAAILVDRDFGGDPEVLDLSGVATVTTVAIPTGVRVTLSVPVQDALPLSDEIFAPWMQIEGTLVLEGDVPACRDDLDNDGDGAADHPADVACFNPGWTREASQCQDGLNNDGDGLIDHDGGASAGVPPAQQTAPDPQCVGKPWRNNEAPSSACGLGFEIAPLLAAWFAVRRLPARRR